MKLIFFVANSASTAPKPNESMNVLRLHLPPRSDRVDDMNAEAFPDADRKSAVVEIQGLSDELQSLFRAGKRVTVSFDVEK